ncbi:MAG TPA: hypothetical protein VF278_08375 [Pirellulales bacterium]
MLWLIVLFLLALLTVAGHGAWVLLAAIFKAIFPTSKAQRCRHCDRFSAMPAGHCSWCGRAQTAPLNDEAADVAAIGRQLRRWQARGLIQPETVVGLLAKIEAWQRPAARPTAELAKLADIKPRGSAELAPQPRLQPQTPARVGPRPAGNPTVGWPAEPSLAADSLAGRPTEKRTPKATEPPPVAAPPRRSFAEMLSTFMEQRNIRWGELVGGLIIVCSSVALVISIWDQLKAIPYFQFFIFVAVSAALFGIGLYTEHRWKLASTSRGLLTIATLLTPLNFVAMVATRRPGFDPLALVMELAALAVFSALVYRAGRVLVAGWAGWLTLAVVGNSGLLLLLIGRPGLLWATGVASAATILHAAALAKPLLAAQRRGGLSAAFVNRLFLLVGAAAFALIVAFSMIVVRGGDHLATLHALAPLLSMGCAPSVLCGLAVMRGLTTSDDAALRTAGTAVALVGAVAMLAATAAAWPLPISLVAVGLINFAALAAIAIVHRLRPLHLPAAASLAIAYIVACHWGGGHLAAASSNDLALTLARLLIDGQTGLWLVGCVALLLMLAEVLARFGRHADARQYLRAGAVVATASVALVAWPVLLSGGDHSARAGLVFAVYGIGGLPLGTRLRSRSVESLATVLIYAAALLGTTAWLTNQPWVAHDPPQFASRPSLQYYAAAWVAVSLVFLLLRLAGRSGLDRWMPRIGAAAGVLLAVWQAMPGIAAELFGTAVSTAVWANDTTPGWLLFSLCAAGLLTALWHGWRDVDVAAAVLLSIGAAVLAVIPAASSMATASALRWSLAITFASSSAILWFRGRLLNAGERLHCRWQFTSAAAPTARAIWLTATALPVVGCSVLVAAMQIAGQRAAGPQAGTWFAWLGMEASHLVPLAAIVLTMIVYAVRESSPGYAFLGGLVANLTVSGGYALVIRSFDAVEAARLAQLATITAAAWAIAWLAARRRVLAAWRQPASRGARPLLSLQVAQAALGGVLLLATATAIVFFSSSDGLPGPLHTWVATVGSPLGWFAVALACAATIYRSLHFRDGVRAELAGLFGLVVLSLAASSVEAVLPGTPWAYRTLMLSWAIYALAIVVAASRAAVIAIRPHPSPGHPLAGPEGKGVNARGYWVRVAALWVRVSGLLAVALALKTVLFEGIHSAEVLWAAPAIGIASAACAAMAIWLRREGWAFTAGLGANLAASLMVAYRLAAEGHAIGAEWILLWQANTTAAAVVAIVWLTAWRRMYARGVSPAASPLLTVQIGAVAVSALGLLGMAVAVLLGSNAAYRPLAEQLASNAGWYAWLSACAALAGYLYHTSRRDVLDVLAVFLLGAGVRAAIARFAVDPSTAVALLAGAWIAAGFFLLIVGCVGNRRLAMQSGDERGAWLRDLFNRQVFERWVALIPVLVALVAVRQAQVDVSAANGLAARVLLAAILPAALAVWLRVHWHLYSSAMLTNLAAALFWYVQPERLWTDLLLANTLAAAATAIFWSIWSRLFGPLEARPARDASPPIEHAAAIIATSLLAAAAIGLWFAAALDTPLAATRPLVWMSAVAVAVANLFAFWDRRASFAAAGLYVTGLAAIAFGLLEHGEQGPLLARLTAPCLAAWLCAAAGIRLAMAATLRARLRLPRHRRVRDWFSPTQAALALAVTVVSLWIGVGFASPGDRLAAPITTGLALAAALLMSVTGGGWSHSWRIGALTLTAILPAEAAWCWLSGDDPAILWMHRQAALLSAIGLVVFVCEFVATKRLAAAVWLDSLRRFLPLAIGAMLWFLGVLLINELHYRAGMPYAADGTRPNMPLALVAKLATAAVMVELIVLALRYAIVAARDPLALTLGGRTAYVYAAELLALFVCLHFRTTMPKLLPFSFIENWWTLIVMVVAFVGAGLSEFFRQRQLEVLSLPLARTAAAAPLAPVFALLLYLVWRPADINEWLFRARMISDEAVFFLVAGFYALQARLRRWPAAVGFSALAGNAGLWLLWQRLRLQFLVHPQLWLIPPAMAVLAAEYINRDRLSRRQSSAVRYLALSVIYVSSTADVFISHVGRDISLPLVLVLMGLSVLGILIGMLLEVRPFVYLGFTFLLVDLSIMVYHAAWDLGHTWIFWAAGIAVGAAIIALFAVFEKRRNEVAKQPDSLP